MNNPWDIVKELEADGSRLVKEAIIQREAVDSNDEFFAGCRLALDAMTTFGVKQVDLKEDASGLGLVWKDFVKLADDLSSRTLTGHAALAAIANAMKLAKPEQWNLWYRRILIKDLRCGASEKTINKVVEKKYPNYAIPVFSCQLAHDSANHESKVSGEKLIEVKLDGVRVITIVYPSGHVDQYSRNGKELVNFPHIKNQISKCADVFAEPVVLDGEIMSASFQDLMKMVHRKSDVDANDAVLNLFDVITLREFQLGIGENAQVDRSVTLAAWYGQFADAMPNVTIVGQELVDLSTPGGAARFRQINQDAVEGGYEGIMIKDPHAVYECKRSVAWLKLKPYIEVSLTVIAVEEGTGRNVGKLGALICEGEDDGKRIRVNVGSGFSDIHRDTYWQERDKVVGQIVEVRADAATKSQDSETTWSLRFPRFLRFRGFEPGEKL
jgi:DNA ligase-1